MTDTVLAKPCPFCGDLDVCVKPGSTFRWRIAQCEQCGAQCGEVRVQTRGDGTPAEWEEDAVREAIEEWNMRS